VSTTATTNQDRSTDPDYLRYQYGDAEKLRIRLETHQRFSEHPDELPNAILAHLALTPGHTLLDVGCGPGTFHRLLADTGARIVGLDRSLGMVQDARRQATEYGLPAEVMQADAQALPVRDVSCDRVLASHMLYHVPDAAKALREMRRVLRPGGRVVLTTNAADFAERLQALHRRAAEAQGYTPTPSAFYRFTLDDLPLVRTVFPTAEMHLIQNAFVFTGVDPVLRYYASGPVDGILERRADGSHRAALLASVETHVQTILAREGVLRIPKNAGCIVAEV
jgi:ubiquinone/menaquinone biosynthesis C-methylase UbiE